METDPEMVVVEVIWDEELKDVSVGYEMVGDEMVVRGSGWQGDEYVFYEESVAVEGKAGKESVKVVNNLMSIYLA